MRTTISFCIVFFLFHFITNAQELHTPDKIFKILEESEVVYNIEMATDEIKCPDYSTNLNFNNVYRIVSDSGIYTYEYDLSPEAAPFFATAEEFFGAKELDSAIVYYEKVLEVQPDFYQVMTYIGQMHGSLGRLDEALSWYKKTLELNYIDYLTHFLISDIYRLQGDIDNAIAEITLARVFNRNNANMAKAQFKLYEQKKLNTEDWYFNPQYKLETDADGAVHIKTSMDWLGYALTKAVWKYEPGYKESMGVGKSEYSSKEDEEALKNLYVVLMQSNKKAFKNDNGLKLFRNSFKKNYFDEFLMYEVILPKYPSVIYQLDKDFIEEIADYVLNVRHKK